MFFQSLSRRKFVGLAGAAGLTMLNSVKADAAASTPAMLAPVAYGKGLAQPEFLLLPLGAIRPTGWLRRQLEVQAQGLSGHLDETWPDVGPNSGWLGGTGESWERGPYFLDGLLPMAYLLEDRRLKEKSLRYIEWTLNSRRPDGLFGPVHQQEDWWPRMVMLKALTQYYEVSGDQRVIPLMEAYFANQRKNLPGNPLSSWARARWQDNVLTVLWLYNRNGDPQLLELAKLLKQQGYDWKAMYANFPFTRKVTREDFAREEHTKEGNHPSHGVNNAMALKAVPLWSLVSHSDEDRNYLTTQWETLDRYHGLANGMFSADEHFAGNNPSQGIELCAVVEAMFSIEQAMAISGQAALGDRLEKIAYNALPGTLSDDMWTHQYDQQPNQIECGFHSKPWSTNGTESNLFGLEPNFGCCTANFHQGWPKLTSSLVMASQDKGLAVMVYAPCIVSTLVRNTPVTMEVATDYPFRNTVEIRVSAAQTIAMPLHLRVPEGEQPIFTINGQAVTPAVNKGFARIERSWQPNDVLRVSFAMKPRIVEGAMGTVSVMRGPLVFSMPIEEQWTKIRDRGLTADWQIFGESPWNYGLVQEAALMAKETPIGVVPFAKATPGITIAATGARLADWHAEDGTADAPPTDLAKNTGAAAAVELVPYASTKLRITSFPKATVKT
ncbi:MAG: glycoside hydrolase family 127 protein [Edaphobacter sp.]|uniref:beta-L-arabinofuranosidase domain-containing protein n=1 Tax=Edaphobacter sp. TaxID=1934404 RepID=UPI0023821661|nr:beta-L-arabinofuranosidase domain-containing protein [Edaphobacter sp.]MDE1178784.1 glycoside hydrolase family 127 protein [Edaphobacter sp.]